MLVVTLIVFIILISVNGLLLKAACWLYNYLFASFGPIPRDEETLASSAASTQTAGNYVASETDQTNPFSPPRHTADPTTANNGAQVVVPTAGVSFGLGVLLAGMQLVLLIVGAMLVPILAANDSIRGGIVLATIFTATAGFVFAFLTSRFNRALVVTGMYYALLLVLASPPLIVFMLLYRMRLW